MLFLQNVLSFVIIYLSLRESESSLGKVFTFEKVQPDLPPRGRGPPAGGGRSSRKRWKEFPQAVEGVPACGGRRYPQIPFKSPNVFMAYVAMPQAAASPRPGAVKAARDGRLNSGLRILDNEAFFRLHADEIRRHQENLRVGLAPGDVRSVGNRVEIIAQPQPRQDKFRVLAGRTDRQLQPHAAQSVERLLHLGGEIRPGTCSPAGGDTARSSPPPALPSPVRSASRRSAPE